MDVAAGSQGFGYKIVNIVNGKQDCTNNAVGTQYGSSQPCGLVARQIGWVLHTSQGLNNAMSALVEGSLWAADLKEVGWG